MSTVLIVIHLMVVLAMIALVLLQRSEGGALGIGGGGGLVSRRGAGNVLTRTTGILAAVFFATSILLTVLARMETRPGDILQRLPVQSGSETLPQPPAGSPEAPSPSGPGVLDALRQQSGGEQPQAPAGQGSGPQQPPAEGGQ